MRKNNPIQEEGQHKGLTLIELVVVVLIIGILAGIAVPLYTKARERSIDSEAQAVLKLLWAAQRNYGHTLGEYYPGSTASPKTYSDIKDINKYLGVDLATSSHWSLSLEGDEDTFEINMTRANPFGRTYRITHDSDNVTCDADCGYLY